MDINNFTQQFQKAADLLDKKQLKEKQIEVAVGVYLDSVFLKLYKRSWANPAPNPLTVPSRIFFSVWINDSILREQKIYYNIHALKLRQLKGYSIESRKFADAFRIYFREFEPEWPNVSVKFGPLTLMQGWEHIDPVHLKDVILALTNNFLNIDHLVDNTLLQFKQ